MLVELWGEGPRVVLIHGAMTGGPETWSRQRPLAERWQLVVVTRPGFAPSPPEPDSDFERDAAAVAELLEEPAHVVGHSYGGLIALLAANERQDSVRSLTVIEPAVMSLRRGDADVEASIANHLSLLATHGADPRAFLAAFTESLGGDPSTVPDPLPEPLRQNVELLMHERFPWEAVIPTESLSQASFPKLIVSGGYSDMQEALCDDLAARLGDSVDRVALPGRGHVVQRTGAPFNDRLEHFLVAATTPT